MARFLLSVCFWRTVYVSFKYFSVIAGIGESHHTGNVCNATRFFQQWEALLDSVKQQVVEQGHMHMLKKRQHSHLKMQVQP